MVQHNTVHVNRGECVRLKRFVMNPDITGNIIEKCGLFDFTFDDGNKNGEGVYIGTSTDQVRGHACDILPPDKRFAFSSLLTRFEEKAAKILYMSELTRTNDERTTPVRSSPVQTMRLYYHMFCRCWYFVVCCFHGTMFQRFRHFLYGHTPCKVYCQDLHGSRWVYSNTWSVYFVLCYAFRSGRENATNRFYDNTGCPHFHCGV